jgi:NAD(P)-dependent dehydrogenase (short-subunit alcohol dehydrogenase family)
MVQPYVAQGMRRFEGRGVIVTGGASGIGAATVRRFLAEGAHVAVVDHNGAALEMDKPTVTFAPPADPETVHGAWHRSPPGCG